MHIQTRRRNLTKTTNGLRPNKNDENWQASEPNSQIIDNYLASLDICIDDDKNQSSILSEMRKNLRFLQVKFDIEEDDYPYMVAKMGKSGSSHADFDLIYIPLNEEGHGVAPHVPGDPKKPNIVYFQNETDTLFGKCLMLSKPTDELTICSDIEEGINNAINLTMPTWITPGFKSILEVEVPPVYCLTILVKSKLTLEEIEQLEEKFTDRCEVLHIAFWDNDSGEYKWYLSDLTINDIDPVEEYTDENSMEEDVTVEPPAFDSQAIEPPVMNDVEERLEKHFTALDKWDVEDNSYRTSAITAKDDRPVVDVTDNDIVSISDKAFNLLQAANDPDPQFFTNGQGIVQLIRNQTNNRLNIVPMDKADLRYVLMRMGKWVKVSGKDQIEKNVVPSDHITGDIFASTNHSPLPKLERLVQQPFFDYKGALHSSPGFSSESRTILELTEGTTFYAVPEAPSPENIRVALHLIDGTLAGFNFETEADRAHAIAMILLFLTRDMIDGPTPLHVVESSEFGAGKTHLVESIIMAITARDLETTAFPRGESEVSRHLTAQLLKSPQYLFFDNISDEVRISSAEFAQALTGSIRGGRILGKSKVVSMSTRVIWLASGVNLSMSKELLRRSIRIRLKMATKFPHKDHLGWVMENRPKILWAGLTIVQAWIQNGRPEANKSLRSFNRWARSIGGMLENVGINGLLDNQEEFTSAGDPLHDAYLGLVTSWWEEFGTRKVKSATLMELLEDEDIPLTLDGKSRNERIADLGNRLRQLKGKNLNNLSIQDAGLTSGSRNWRLVELP
jgi:hypothetical protein